MTTPEDRLAALGLTLPPPATRPPGVALPFTFVNVRGQRAVFSGHLRHDMTGKIDGLYGRFGETHDTDAGYAAARGVALSVLANMKDELGELSRIAGWVRVFAMVTSTPEITDQHLVANGFSDLIIEVFGPDASRHARSALGVASLPMGFAMEIEGEVLLRG
ncbi:enamine deaminase RidA (YjgF/YER057c/UK114 family) [Maritimibacter alkaliphilus HTCC2654]|uniref:Endoribonuclease L-PSP n=1 Tax=Maritimibacter alkaliphilus HTCC2654 TaxID=314271 RepID=A3VFD4_9RHOB|nr:RidA family protein [Maritimibacter alkaliphilus]EAQ13049.1 Endoribonuclease L-PSP [Rhodobacterales bacterium HTCC2654] [Maritimibacter alkaliphilus HTCC2654]TYP79983.1 enamine deaminase RidA (YjgF/YER057c/UK114 family) [Maritimibacter alkaliphilus HTCC2654]